MTFYYLKTTEPRHRAQLDFPPLLFCFIAITILWQWYPKFIDKKIKVIKLHACKVASVVSHTATLMDCSWPGSSVHGVLQTRILEWVAMPSPRILVKSLVNLPNPGIKPASPVSPALQVDSLSLSHQGSQIKLMSRI